MAEIRDAVASDLPAMLAIFNASILTTATWSDHDQTLDERAAWFADRKRAGEGVLVAEVDGQVVGFAAYGAFRDNQRWPGYRFTVENSVHVAESCFGQGIGRALMEPLIEHASARGLHQMIAAVDAENAGSVQFHQALGFRETGRLSQVGWKFDRWLDLVLLQRQL